jgi:hypothetical protein
MADRSIDKLLCELSLGSKQGAGSDETARANKKLQAELDLTAFTVFTSISDLGYYTWTPGGRSHKDLSNIRSAIEIIDGIQVDEKPREIVPVSHLRLPTAFDMSIAPQNYANKYPYGQYEIASLHVASKHRGVELNELDFIFGGSTLEMLAQNDMSNPYMATRVPGTGTVIVIKCKEYIQNYSDVGFQFERLVTGLNMTNQTDIEYVEHMHIMQVGVFKIMFCAETDAMDRDGNPIEVKVSNPQYWGTKVMFQMISSGSPTLCHGVKGRNVLTRVNMRRLSDVARDALSSRNHVALERNILNGLTALKEHFNDVEDDGRVYKISFASDGELLLTLAKTRSAVLLPPIDIVQALL